MSDERDSAGSAGDGTDTAVANRPLRPTGKRSRRGAADGDEVDTTTETKAAVTNNGSDTKTAKKAGVPEKAGATRSPSSGTTCSRWSPSCAR